MVRDAGGAAVLRRACRAAAPARSPWRILALAAAASLPAAPAWPAKWDIVPALAVEETYSDNIALAPRGAERGDFVTTISPRLTVRATGERMRLDAEYRPEFLWWANAGATRALHFYDAGGAAELVERTLFVEARSTQSEKIYSLLGPVTDSAINFVGNRATVRSSYVSPYLQHAFGPWADGRARLTWSALDSDAAFVDSHATTVDLTLASGPTYKLLKWNLAAFGENIDYDDPRAHDLEARRVTAGVKRLLTPTIAIVANGGYEDNNYLTSGPEPRGAIWNAGGEWSPTPRTRLAATAGRRFFGPTRAFDFSHRTRQTIWNASYIEDVSTARSEFLIPGGAQTAGFLDALFTSTIPDPAARQGAVNSFIARNALSPNFSNAVNFFATVPFVLKRAQASVGIHGVRNTVLATVFRETRDALGPDPTGATDFAFSDTINETGANLIWTSLFTARTSLNVGAGIARSELVDIGRRDNYKQVRIGLTHAFLPRLSGSLLFRRLQNDSTIGVRNFVENAISVRLNATF